ncbi:SurA N-terminal domain-containing protein [Allostreptomyces psammosilenae]|uniref:Lipoprotein n=1 Tax=Allostreptomyces psammosilenae TaxID=1892865 RepID=A0A852ZZ89_9ACTN|nr:SurA N-terminal domain-containing protein [Allostreptomyces psammosilenae]NYI06014.1 hypothetical protein [Allostreptomyces psammosilenae]
MSRAAAARPAKIAYGSAAALAAALALTACGTPHANSAAVVGADRITVPQFQDTSAEITRVADELRMNAADPSRRLSNLIEFSVVEQAAEDAGITVTQTAVLDARRDIEEQTGGGDSLRAALAQQGVAPEDFDRMVRVLLLEDALVERAGADPATPEGQQRRLEVLVSEAERLGVTVNPRYGDWGPNDFTLTPAVAPWIHQEPAAGPGAVEAGM